MKYKIYSNNCLLYKNITTYKEACLIADRLYLSRIEEVEE